MKIADLDTPVLMVDADKLDRNIARMKDMTEATGIAYRPHSKTHKSPEIARRQIDAGAIGICCAKLGEAEIMAASGIENILITTAVVGQSKIGRLMHARNQVPLAVVADNAANVEMLGQMAQMAGQKLDVLVEADIGQGRCGVQSPEEALDLGRMISDHPWLSLAGLQGYQGAIQMIGDTTEREAATSAALDRLAEIIATMEAGGLDVPVRTGGGTGTSPYDLERGLLSEVQTGSYVFMDSRYGGIGWPGANTPPFEQSLHILTSVVSKPLPGRAVVDAGLKSASNDHGPPVVTDDADQVFSYGGDEHGIIAMKDGGAVPFAVGDRLRLTPSHCDTTVNLYDQYIVIQGDEVVDVWPIEGRGRTQ